jgi:TatA/E family protein of Tat protein translocase
MEMDFLGMGGWEIILILIIVLLLWGPGKIVEIARTLGKIVHTLKNTSSLITTQITKEMEEQKKENPSKPEDHIQP